MGISTTDPNRMQSYRARQREAGMRLLQIWVPDTRSAAFAAECKRQSILASQSPDEQSDLAFIEAVGDFSE